MAARLRVSVSIRHGAPPRPGAQSKRWAWNDVLERPPPRTDDAHEALFVVRHGHDEDHEDPASRVAYATLVEVDRDEGGATLVEVDELVCVEPRVLSPVLVVERAVSRRVAAGSKAGLRLVTRGSDAISHRVGGKPGAAIQRGTGATVRLLEWAGATLHDTVHAMVEAPDRLWQGATTSGAHLSRRRERKELFMGMLAPHALSREGKAASLFVAGAFLLSLMLAVTLTVFLFHPSLVEEWRAMLLYFLLGVGSTMLFPAFPEFRLPEVASALDHSGAPHEGAVLAILTVALAMTVGAWFVLFLGDAIHGTLRAGIRPGSRLAVWLDKAEAFARRRGFWAAFIPLAIPLGPDTPVFYVLASVKTPPLQYLSGAFLGLVVRFSLWYFVPVLWYDVLMDGYYV